MAFEGFPKGTAKFLTALAKNNDRAWLEKNRKAYDEDLIEPALAFVEAMGPELRKISRGVRAEPRVGGSVMRMNRDTRFAKDKSPYKTHLDIFFWEGDQKGWDRPGFFFRFQLIVKRSVCENKGELDRLFCQEGHVGVSTFGSVCRFE